MTGKQFLNFAPALALIALASCGASNHAPNTNAGEGTMDNATLTRLNLTSGAFKDSQPIPTQFTCDGANRSPPLSWGEPPAGTKSFALVVDDPDAPSGTFGHWGAYDIPPGTRSIGEAQSVGTQAINGFGKTGYGGPCPPAGHGPHHYHFKLYALNTGALGLPAGAKVEDVEKAAQEHVLGRGEIVGTYQRR
jgi:Raf kinase inhibitor-like YbhB/YbcL family protein